MPENTGQFGEEETMHLEEDLENGNEGVRKKRKVIVCALWPFYCWFVSVNWKLNVVAGTLITVFIHAEKGHFTGWWGKGGGGEGVLKDFRVTVAALDHYGWTYVRNKFLPSFGHYYFRCLLLLTAEPNPDGSMKLILTVTSVVSIWGVGGVVRREFQVQCLFRPDQCNSTNSYWVVCKTFC